MTEQPTDLPIVSFDDATSWESWLVAHATSKGLWLKIAKKDAGTVTVTYAEALEVALCNGWIDGQKRSLDERFFLQRFTPRRPKSLWSKINIGHVERLIAAGRMREGGQREIDSARADKYKKFKRGKRSKPEAQTSGSLVPLAPCPR